MFLPPLCGTSKLFILQNVTSFDAMIRKLVYFFETSLRCCDNTVVHSFLNSDMFNCSQIVRRWHAILFNFQRQLYWSILAITFFPEAKIAIN